MIPRGHLIKSSIEVGLRSGRNSGIIEAIKSYVSSVITKNERDYFANRIVLLCKEKQYRLETYFLAVNIFDHFLAMVDSRTMITPDNKAAILTVLLPTVTIMAAKLE